MRVRIRYDYPDETGETRRERAERFGREETARRFSVPDEGWYIWEWYWTISARLRRVRDGVCEPVPASEFLAWCDASQTIVSAPEYAILCAMDEAFCSETNNELQDYHAREEEKYKRNRENMPWRKGG